MNCSDYDKCITNERQNLRHHKDQKSLYAKRVYDNQTANRRCYEKNPINIEGFGNINLQMIIKWALILLVIYVIIMLAIDLLMPSTEIKLGVSTPATVKTEVAPVQ